jgi:hypothetical protein
LQVYVKTGVYCQRGLLLRQAALIQSDPQRKLFMDTAHRAALEDKFPDLQRWSRRV